MALEGLHHITAITADAPRNVDFYARALGLRLVKKTVNFDQTVNFYQPDIYHLYYGDENGTPGSILTFFEFPGVARGTPGAGMPYRILWRVRDAEAVGFWSARLGDEGVTATRTGDSLRFADFEGLEHELVAEEVPDPPLAAQAGDIPPEHALLGFAGVRAYAAVYFREPSGVLFELATRDIGFAVDEPLATLGAELKLPAQHESRREQLERALTPIANPRAAA